MQGIIDRLATSEGTRVTAHDPTFLPAFQPICVSSDLDRPPHSTGIDRVAVIVEPHEAGLGHIGWHRMAPPLGRLLRNRLPGRDQKGQHRAQGWHALLRGRPVPHLWVRVGSGIGQAAILKPGVQLSIAFELRTRHKEPPPDHTHLVLNLTLLPARSGCAGPSLERHWSERQWRRIDQIVPTHLLEPAIIDTILANKNLSPLPSSLDHCPRTNGGQGLAVIDPPRTGPAKKGECPLSLIALQSTAGQPVMSVEHHLQRLARIARTNGIRL